MKVAYMLVGFLLIQVSLFAQGIKFEKGFELNEVKAKQDQKINTFS